MLGKPERNAYVKDYACFFLAAFRHDCFQTVLILNPIQWS